MRKDSGFTFIELMVVILVISIISAIAIPLWINWLPSYRLKSASRDLYSAFQKTKLEAVRRNVAVVLSFDPVNDVYTMFVDDGNGGGTPNDFIFQNAPPGTQELLLGNFAMPANVTLVSTTFAGNAAGFNSRGLPLNQILGTVTLNNTNGKSDSVTLSMAGHIRLTR